MIIPNVLMMEVKWTNLTTAGDNYYSSPSKGYLSKLTCHVLFIKSNPLLDRRPNKIVILLVVMPLLY